MGTLAEKCLRASFFLAFASAALILVSITASQWALWFSLALLLAARAKPRIPRIWLPLAETREGNQDQVFDLTTDGTEAKPTTSGETCTASASWGTIDGTRLVLTIKQQSANGTVVTSRVMKRGTKGKCSPPVLTVQNPGGKHKALELLRTRKVKREPRDSAERYTPGERSQVFLGLVL